MKPSKSINHHDNKRPAVFLDRDGTIIEDRGHLSDPSQVAFFKDTAPSLRRLTEHFTLFIVTNQSGVAKSIITMEDVHRVNDYVVKQLAAKGIPIAATYVCPHERSTGCRCIKPNPHFLKIAEHEFGIDLQRSFTIGDHPHDVELAAQAGATGIFVLTGHGTHHVKEISAQTVIAADIAEAAEKILTLQAEERKAPRKA